MNIINIMNIIDSYLIVQSIDRGHHEYVQYLGSDHTTSIAGVTKSRNNFCTQSCSTRALPSGTVRFHREAILPALALPRYTSGQAILEAFESSSHGLPSH